MKQLVKTYNNCYFPASLIKDHKRSFNYNLPKYYKPNLITVAKNSLHNSQYCSIYPYRSKGIGKYIIIFISLFIVLIG